MKDPLKQGLKPCFYFKRRIIAAVVEVKDPLKQGLKQAVRGKRQQDGDG